MRRALILLAAGLWSVAAAGPDTLGRLALRAGADGLAARLLPEGAARGVALYRQGDYAGADAAFARAGRAETYNRGLSLAASGQHALAVAYFDAVLFANPADGAARQARDLTLAMIPPHVVASDIPGRIKMVTGGAAAPAPITDPFKQANASDPSWRCALDAKGLAAGPVWLETISDDPGEFLRLRLRAEHDRRTALGLIRPQEAMPW